MFETILLATDGSDAAMNATGTALELADRFDATLHALFVIDHRFVAHEFDAVVEKAEAEGENALEQVEAEAETVGRDVTLHLRRGIPHDEIIDAIDDYGADLVVVAATGASGLDRVVNLGSTAERVIRRASVHVMVAPPPGVEG